MVDYDWGGWVILSNGTDTYKIKCERPPELDIDDPSAIFIDYPADGHTGLSFGSRVRKVKFQNIWFISQERYDQFLAFLEASQNAKNLTLRIQTSSLSPITGASGTNGVTSAATDNFSSAGATFSTNGVVAGDIVVLSDGVDAGTYIVTTVDSETQLSLEDLSGNAISFTGDTSITYTVNDITYQDWNGNDKTTMPVMWEPMKGLHKPHFGDVGIWTIKQLVLRQKGTLTD